MKNRFGIHPDVLKLGLVSFLTDVSSEMIFSVFAIFFTTVAGASSALLGLVEGLADFSASSLNYLAGWLSDRSGKRKVFALVLHPGLILHQPQQNDAEHGRHQRHQEQHAECRLRFSQPRKQAIGYERAKHGTSLVQRLVHTE